MTADRDTEARPVFIRVDSLQVPVPTLDEGLEFYRRVLGDVVKWRTAKGLALVMLDGTEVVLQTERQDPETDLLVEDADEAASRFQQAGGRIVVPAFDIAVGRCAVVADPWNNTFVVLDLSKGTYQTDAEHRVIAVSKAAEGAADAEANRLRSVAAPSAIRDVYVIVRRGDDVLLLLRAATGYKDGEWGLPSGKVETGETYAEAGARELGEETGLSVASTDLRFLHAIERVPATGEHWVGTFFEVRLAGVEPRNCEPAKHAEIRWFAESALPDSTVDYVQHVLRASSRGERYSEWTES